MKRQTTTYVGTKNFYLITLIFINTIIFSSCIEFHRECIITEPNSNCSTSIYGLFAIINNNMINILQHVPVNTCLNSVPRGKRFVHFKELEIILKIGSGERSYQPLLLSARLSWWRSGKESTCQYRRLGFNPWVGRVPWKRKWQPTPAFLPGNSHGQRSLVGLQPMGSQESQTQLSDWTTISISTAREDLFS